MKKTKLAMLFAVVASVFAMTVFLVACGSSLSPVIGSYCFAGVNQGSRSGEKRQSVSAQTLTLYENGTYSLITTNTTISTSDYANKEPFTTSKASSTLTVYGEYTVIEETPKTDEDYATRTVKLGDINQSIWTFNQLDAVKGTLDTVLGDPDQYPPGNEVYEKYIPYTYIGNSDDFDADMKAKALAWFNIKTKEVTVTDEIGTMSTGISITLHASAVLDAKLNNTTFS